VKKTDLDVIQDGKQAMPDEDLMDDSLREEIEKVLQELDERERDVISLYYGINRERSYTLEEIGENYGLTRERVRQIKEKAIKRLRHARRSKKLKPYLV